MRWLIALLIVLLLVIQQRLWFGDGGLHEIKVREQEIAGREAVNARLRTRNAALQADVDNLKEGLDAIEERARSELGMIRKDEIFYQVIEPVPMSDAATASQRTQAGAQSD